MISMVSPKLLSEEACNPLLADIRRKACLDEHCADQVTRVQISLILLDFWILVNFEIVGSKMGPKGPGRASKGSGAAFHFICTKLQPEWVHLGPIGAPFCFSISPKNNFGTK